MTPTVFISHSSRDSDFVKSELVPFLSSHGISTWYSEEEIRSPDAWERKIREGLTSCSWFLVVLTPSSVDSDWVQAEVHWAMENRKGHVIPLLYRRCNYEALHLKLARIQHIDYRRYPKRAKAALLDVWTPHGGAVQQSDEPRKAFWLSRYLVAAALCAIFGGVLLFFLLHGHRPRPWPFDNHEAKRRQQETADTEGLAVSRLLDLDTDVLMEFVLIPPGEFMMGSDSSPSELAQTFGEGSEYYDHEFPKHRVWIPRAFYMSATEVTRDEFAAFVRATDYQTDAETGGFSMVWTGDWTMRHGATWECVAFEQSGDHPVVNVSWNDAVAFCQWLTTKAQFPCRLPSEAEWEYVCRAGTGTSFQWGNSPADGRGWCNAADATAKASNPGWSCFNWEDGYPYTSPAARFRPNAWGLYDMHGNAWEWCHDWYSADYYKHSQVTAPPGPASGERRIMRGGSWFRGPGLCRSTVRHSRIASGRSYMTGFRVVLDCPHAQQPPTSAYGEKGDVVDALRNEPRSGSE